MWFSLIKSWREESASLWTHSYKNVSEVWNDYKRCFNKQYLCLKILYLQKWAYEKNKCILIKINK